VRDLASLEVFSRPKCELGYAGQLILHRLSVQPIHACGPVEAVEESDNEGRAGQIYQGQDTDYAHAMTAYECRERRQAIKAISPSHEERDMR
jgi:hypothetical protein